MINQWLSSSPNVFGFDKDTDLVKDIETMLVDTPVFSNEEVGLFHPSNSAVVKIRENGCIDIFTATNQGIRIDSSKSTINIVTANELHHISRHHEWVDGYVRFDVHDKFIVNSDNNIEETTKADWNINVKGNANINVNGNVNINAGGDVDVNSDKSINMKCRGTMTFSAPKYWYE